MFAIAALAGLYLAYRFVRTLIVTENDVKSLSVDELHKKLDTEIDRLRKEKKYNLIKETTEDFNLQIFQINNKNRDRYEIDLHGLHIDYALRILKERLNLLIGQRYEGIFTIITGIGNHSIGGIAKIKPKVLQLLDLNDFKYDLTSGGGAVRLFLDRYCKTLK